MTDTLVPVKHIALTTTQRNTLTPAAGTTIFNSTTGQEETYNGTGWDPASLKDIVAAGTVGDSSDIPILGVDTKGRIISYTTAPVTAKSFGSLWGFMHSYGGGPTGATDVHLSFWRRWASVLGVGDRSRNVCTLGGMQLIEPLDVGLSGPGIGSVFVHSMPDHVYGNVTLGWNAPKNSSQGDPSVDMLLAGLNDATAHGGEIFATGGSNALSVATQALRAIMAVRRTARIYNVDDSHVAFGGTGWSAVKTDKDFVAFRRYKETVVADDYVEITLDGTYRGEPVSVDLIGNPGFYTKLNASIATTTATTVQIADNTNLPQSGSFEITVDSERILLDATSGTGVKTLNVHGGVAGRAQGGTTAATHASGATVRRSSNAYVVCSGSTASCSTQVSVGAQDSSGRTYVGAQGSGGRDIQMNQRFVNLTVLDAGKKIRITFKNPTGLSAGSEALRFVAFRIEETDPNTMLLINQPKFNFGSSGSFAEGYIATLNTAIDSLAGEVSNAVVVNVAAEFSARFGATFVGASGTGATFHIKPNSSTRCEIDVGSVLRSGGEEILIDGGGTGGAGTAIDKSNPNDWFVHTQRAWTGVDSGLGTGVTSVAAFSHINGADVYDCKPFREDRVHLTDYGHEIYAEMLFSATNTAPSTSAHLSHSGGSTAESRKHGWLNGAYLYRRGGARANRTMALNKEWAFSLEIPEDGIITSFAVDVRTAGATGALLRVGRYSDGQGCPGYLMYDSGASYGPGTVSGNVVGADTLVAITPTLYIPVKRGRNWFSLCCQGATIGTNGVRGINSPDPDYTIPANATNVVSANEPQGVSRTGVSGALADWNPIVQGIENTDAVTGFGYAYETAAIPLVFVQFEKRRSDL